VKARAVFAGLSELARIRKILVRELQLQKSSR
jgi:hypothetical protein